jgi:prepilin-type N-terminal cleavage/methylation domain-containing protein
MRRRNGREGFTLIELLIVVVIIGILAAIAIPKFASTKEKTYVATMKSDLRNLVTAEEGYLGDNLIYYGGPLPNAAFQYRPTTGVTVTIVAATTSGFQATAAHTSTSRTCAIFYGNIAAVAPAAINGEPGCS